MTDGQIHGNCFEFEIGGIRNNRVQISEVQSSSRHDNLLIHLILSSLVASFRDRFRTVLNVLGDAVGAGIVAHLSRDELKEADQSKMEEGDKEGEGTELIKKANDNPDQIVSNI